MYNDHRIETYYMDQKMLTQIKEIDLDSGFNYSDEFRENKDDRFSLLMNLKEKNRGLYKSREENNRKCVGKETVISMKFELCGVISIV